MGNAKSKALGIAKTMISCYDPTYGICFGGGIAFMHLLWYNDFKAFQREMFSLMLDVATLRLSKGIKSHAESKCNKELFKITGMYPKICPFMTELKEDLLQGGIMKVINSKAKQLTKDFFKKLVTMDFLLSSMNTNSFIQGSITTTLKHTQASWKAYLANLVFKQETGLVLWRNPNGFTCGFVQSAMEDICEPILKQGQWANMSLNVIKSIGLIYSKFEERSDVNFTFDMTDN